MAIVNFGWRRALRRDVEERIGSAHLDLSTFVGWLRDPAVLIVARSPDAPPPEGTQRYSLDGWRIHFREEFKRMDAFVGRHGARVVGSDDALAGALSGYVASIPTIVQAMNVVLSHYTDDGVVQETEVSTADREALATVIEGELA